VVTGWKGLKRKSTRLEFSNVGPTSPRQAVAILPRSDFHELLRAVGPKGQERKQRIHPGLASCR
jgi:hypothetical protein